MKELQVRNRQRDRRVDPRQLRLITLDLLGELGILEFELAIHLVSERMMANVNERFLQHEGPTDVITFDHRDNENDDLQGELYICVAVAVHQAKEFNTTWQAEVVRYATHGILHLLGYDDLTPAKRKEMKRAENRWVRWLAKRYDFTSVGRD